MPLRSESVVVVLWCVLTCPELPRPPASLFSPFAVANVVV